MNNWRYGSDRWGISYRAVFLRCYTSKSCPRTAAHGSLRRRLSASRIARDVRMCSVTRERSRHMEAAPRTDGHGTGLLRKDHSVPEA